MDPFEEPIQIRRGIYDARAAMFLTFVEGKDLLDVGCGYGYDGFLFSKKAHHVTSIDSDLKAIKRASSRLSHIGNLHFEFRNSLDFIGNDRKFDVVVLFESLEHFDFKDSKDYS